MDASNHSLLIAVLAGALRAGTPLVFASAGELIYERSGVINLGLEGFMLIGAISGVWAHLRWNFLPLSILFAMLAGALIGFLHAFLCVKIKTHQIATGLAFVILGSGITAFWGSSLVGKRVVVKNPYFLSKLSSLPIIGPILFQQDIMVYIALVCVIIIWLFFHKTRMGIMLRAAGDNANTAAAAGIPVLRIRILAGILCGALCGLGGAHLSLLYASQWQENMVAGRGWIALVLVIFSMWRPFPLLVGAYLFGGLTALQFSLQARGVQISQYILGTIPFIVTMVLLILANLLIKRKPSGMPLDLGKTYRPEK